MSLSEEKSISSYDLRVRAQQDGCEQRVEVNQRMLIVKILARYSSDFVVCRELIQNSDDAQATSFHFEITCETSSIASDMQTRLINKPTNNDSTDNTSTQISSANTKTTLEPEESASQNESLSLLNPILKFHNSIITEIRTVNNGLIFNQADWKRVASIAEGNTNVDSVGQFGVGFFSVFSFSEEPIITSGNDYMAFVWRDNNSLTTFRHELPIEQQSKLTSVILKMRSKYILQTETNPDINMKTLENKNYESNIKSAKKTTNNITIQEIIPTIDLTQLKVYFTKVFEVKKTKTRLPSIKGMSPFKKQGSITNMLSLNSFVQTEQTFTINNGSSLTLNHVTVDAVVTIDENFHDRMRRILKKSLPSNVPIQLLYAPNNLIADKQSQTSSVNSDSNMKILHSLIPLKFENGDIIPAGLLFMGIATHQTSGIGMHICSRLIPTVERENIDSQDPYIAQWNKELLTSIGQIARLIYDQTISMNFDKTKKITDDYEIALSSYSFQPSVPNNKIAFNRDQATSDNSNTMEEYIQQLIKEGHNMNEADINELKTTKWLIGTTLAETKETKRKYIPKELYFPSVAIELQWFTLPIVDWLDINPCSPEYNFLKEMGVQEIPNLQKLIERIIQEHDEQRKKQNTNEEYKIPLALHFFVDKFQRYYYCVWKTGSFKQHRFFPSNPLGKTINQTNPRDVILLSANEVFKVINPFFPSLLSEVIELFEKNWDISLLGIKDHPSLSQAFDIMIKKKDELLTEQSASKIFAYLNGIEGLTAEFIRRVGQYNFIPLQGYSNGTILMKPSQVFIRSNATSSETTNSRTDSMDRSGLIDYVDYGVDANTFLSNIGVKSSPTPSVLALLLIDRQNAYFASANNDKELLKIRIHVYIDCLKELADAINDSNQFQWEPVYTQLKTKAWCLGFQTIVHKN
ncbi:unnamed protein product, partial [Didymodactylos carnosus]